MYKQNEKTQAKDWPESAEAWFLEWAMSFDAWLDTTDGQKWLDEQEAMDTDRRNAGPWEDRAADIAGWQQ